MSNDELQKAIDDITKGDATASAMATDGASSTSSTVTDDNSGTATVSLPDDMMAEGALADSNLNFTETADSATGTSAELFSAPPAPDTSSVLPEGANMNNPAVSAAPEAPEEVPLGNDPLAGFDAGSVSTENTQLPEPSAQSAPETTVSEAPAATETQVDFSATQTANSLQGVADEAKRELYPLLDLVPSMSDQEKYDICMSVGDEGAIAKALQFAKNIPDNTAKAEALVKIIEKTK